MNRNILNLGLDVDDTQYHSLAVNQQTGEVVDFHISGRTWVLY